MHFLLVFVTNRKACNMLSNGLNGLGGLMADTAGPSISTPAAAAHSQSDPIKLPGGNTLSRSRQPILAATLSGLKIMGGSEWPEFNRALLHATVATISNSDPDAVSLGIAATSAALAAFKPTDEIEGMIAAQAVALHHVCMECLRRAMLPGQMSDVASKLRKDGANLARAMTEMLDALDRKRGKGPQVVRVERVVVHEGGQAIVGNVKGGDASPTAARCAPPIARGLEQSGITLDGPVGGQAELMVREGV
jgi:hypothetical protein